MRIMKTPMAMRKKRSRRWLRRIKAIMRILEV